MGLIAQVTLVAVGGAIGSLCRFLASWVFSLRLGSTVLLSTLAVNMVGSFLVGLVACRMDAANGDGLRLFFVVGFLGGFTTFSAFSLENFRLLEQGRYLHLVGSLFVTPIICLVACWCGYRYCSG